MIICTKELSAQDPVLRRSVARRKQIDVASPIRSRILRYEYDPYAIQEDFDNIDPLSVALFQDNLARRDTLPDRTVFYLDIDALPCTHDEAVAYLEKLKTEFRSRNIQSNECVEIEHSVSMQETYSTRTGTGGTNQEVKVTPKYMGVEL